MKRVRFKAYLYVVGTISFFALLVGSGHISYGVWGQIDYLSRADFSSPSTQLLAHFSRYMVVWPAYYIADFFSFEVDFVYSIYILLLAGITSITWYETRALVLNSSAPIFPMVTLVPFGLLFAVNGRFMFALFGLTLILYSIVRSRSCKFDSICLSATLVGLFYSSVSSGTFTVGLLFLLWALKDLHKREVVQARIISVIGVPLVLIPALFLGWLFIDKNLSYYEEETGSAFRIISHGIGMFVDPSPVVEQCASSNAGGFICWGASFAIYFGPFVSAILLVLLLASLIVFVRYLSFPLLVSRGIFLSVLMGTFGFTTLFSVIFLMPIAISRRKCKKVFR